MRKILLSIMLVLTTIGMSAGISNAAKFTEGKEYLSVEAQPTDSGEKVEVLEFFWYGCPHCYTFEPYISQWLKTKSANVEFARVPTVFRPDWKVHARTYYALEELGKVDKVHTAIFEEIHKNRKLLGTQEEMTEFLVKHGIDKKAFTEAYNSFSVDGNMRKAIKKQSAFNVTGVPSVVVNGKYLTTASMAGTYEKLLEVIDFLITKESAE